MKIRKMTIANIQTVVLKVIMKHKQKKEGLEQIIMMRILSINMILVEIVMIKSTKLRHIEENMSDSNMIIIIMMIDGEEYILRTLILICLREEDSGSLGRINKITIMIEISEIKTGGTTNLIQGMILKEKNKMLPIEDIRIMIGRKVGIKTIIMVKITVETTKTKGIIIKNMIIKNIKKVTRPVKKTIETTNGRAKIIQKKNHKKFEISRVKTKASSKILKVCCKIWDNREVKVWIPKMTTRIKGRKVK